MTAYEVRIADLDDPRRQTLRLLEAELGVRIVAIELRPRPAKLSADQFKKLRAAEKELGVHLIAYEHAPRVSKLPEEERPEWKAAEAEIHRLLAVDATAPMPPLAALSQAQLARLRAAELELGVFLLSYGARPA